MLVSYINWDPLLDTSEARDQYLELDKVLANILRILNTDKSDEDIIEFAAKSMENGGLSLIYLGVYHQLMRISVAEMRKPNGVNIFHQLLCDLLKIGYVMNSYEMLCDEAFRYVSSIYFTPMKPDKRIKCDLCNQTIGSVFHE